MSGSPIVVSKESSLLKLRDILEQFDERLGSRPEPEILTLTEKMGFVAQRERFNKRLAIADTSDYKVIGLHDIAFNPYLLWAGAVAQNTGWETAIISPLYPTFRVRKGYSPRFVNHLLCSGFLRSRFDAISYGSVPRKRRATVRDFLDLGVQMPVPPLPEQERIVKLLDEADELRKLRVQADRRTAALIPALFQEMLGHEKWPHERFGTVLAEPLRNGLSPAKDGKYLGKVFTLSAITGSSFDESAWKEAPFARQPETKCIASEHLFLICRGSGSRELVGCGKFPVPLTESIVFPDTMIAAVPQSESLLPAFLEAAWQRPATRAQIQAGARTTSGTFKINQTVIEDIRLPVPPLPLQKEFAQRVTEIRALEGAQTASRRRLEDLFQSLLHRAFDEGF